MQYINWKSGLVMLSASLMLLQPQVQAGSASKLTAPEDPVRNVLMDLESALTTKKVESATALFAEDADFIDQSGEEIRGRKDIGARFNQVFKMPSPPAVGIHPLSISFLTNDVALVLGEVSRKQDDKDLPSSRFSMVVVKKSNVWQIKQITETAIQTGQSDNRLQELDWLVGKWTLDKPDGNAQLDVEWAPNKKFLTSKTTISRTGKPAEVDTQVIGWDPQHNSIVSWHFDSNGGFGSGTWSKLPRENKWTVRVNGVGADGSSTTASNTFTLKAPDEFVWQSIQRSLDGVGVPDSEALTLRKAK